MPAQPSLEAPSPGEAAPPLYLILARVLRPHGIRGDLSIQVVTDFPERIKSLEKVYLGASETDTAHLTPYRVDNARLHHKVTWLLHLHGIDDRDMAETLRDKVIFVALDDAVPLEADEVYLYQVMGLQVETVGGQALGRVVDIIETGANDVYVIQGAAYGEVLVPAIDGIVLEIDVEAGIMRIDPPPGLLPTDSDPASDAAE